MATLNRQTLMPIGVAVSVMIFFLFLTVNSVERFVKLEQTVANQQQTYLVQSQMIKDMNIHLRSLNNNMIRLSEIIKKLEEKIK